jgi:hypothetical protein
MRLPFTRIPRFRADGHRLSRREVCNGAINQDSIMPNTYVISLHFAEEIFINIDGLSPQSTTDICCGSHVYRLRIFRTVATHPVQPNGEAACGPKWFKSSRFGTDVRYELKLLLIDARQINFLASEINYLAA